MWHFVLKHLSPALFRGEGAGGNDLLCCSHTLKNGIHIEACDLSETLIPVSFFNNVFPRNSLTKRSRKEMEKKYETYG